MRFCDRRWVCAFILSVAVIGLSRHLMKLMRRNNLITKYDKISYRQTFPRGQWWTVPQVVISFTLFSAFQSLNFFLLASLIYHGKILYLSFLFSFIYSLVIVWLIDLFIHFSVIHRIPGISGIPNVPVPVSNSSILNFPTYGYFLFSASQARIWRAYNFPFRKWLMLFLKLRYTFRGVSRASDVAPAV